MRWLIHLSTFAANNPVSMKERLYIPPCIHLENKVGGRASPFCILCVVVPVKKFENLRFFHRSLALYFWLQIRLHSRCRLFGELDLSPDVQASFDSKALTDMESSATISTWKTSQRGIGEQAPSKTASHAEQ